MRYVDQDLSDKTLDIEGNEFIRCKFQRSTLVYRANGKQSLTTGCEFLAPYRLAFADDARRTLEWLVRLRDESPEKAHAVERLFDAIIAGSGVGEAMRDLSRDFLHNQAAQWTCQFLRNFASQGPYARETVNKIRVDVRAGDFLREE